MSTHIKKVGVCHLAGAADKLSELVCWLSVSKNAAKKFLSKKELTQKIHAQEELLLPLNLINWGKINPEYIGEEVKILFEDENLLALDKPAKIHMHPLSYDEKDNLLSFLRQTRKDDLLNVNKENYDRGLLFRLDYETSGVCLYAKKNELYLSVRQNFSSMAKRKEYLAIVKGKFPKELELNDRMIPSGIKNKKMKNDKNGELAQLKAILLAHHPNKELSLVKIELRTGLRHQIRFQLANAGFPILGESLYAEDFTSKRLYLHAACYELKLDHDKIYNICAPMPKLFKDFFDLN